MSLNTAHRKGGVLIYSGELILIFCDGVHMSFDGGQLPSGTKKGRIYLTTHRVIFTNKSSDPLQSFSMPFYMMKEVELDQPIFGANCIKGKVMAEQGGNWTGTSKFKISFQSGGAIDFGQAMLHAGRLAAQFKPPQPPPYTPPQGPIYQPQPPAYTATDQYGWVPYQVFPSAPPVDGVYMTESPPPYPGISPATAPYPPAQPTVNETAADSKAREAAAKAYYNPTNPHDIYVPSPSEPPPTYEDAIKKNV